MDARQGEFPYFEDMHDALRTLVTKLGGTKKVAPKIWPEKGLLEAQSLLSDCLNPLRREKLSPQQLLLLLRWGRDEGHHEAISYICYEAGYDAPKSRSAKEEAESLLDRAAELAQASRVVATQLERLHASGVLRQVGKTGT